MPFSVPSKNFFLVPPLLLNWRKRRSKMEWKSQTTHPNTRSQTNLSYPPLKSFPVLCSVYKEQFLVSLDNTNQLLGYWTFPSLGSRSPLSQKIGLRFTWMHRNTTVCRTKNKEMVPVMRDNCSSRKAPGSQASGNNSVLLEGP